MADPQWEQGCAFPDGQVHDHGNAACHAATAVKTAQQAVTAFLHGLGDGQELALCENPQCRTALYKVPRVVIQVPRRAGKTRLSVCPSCGGSPT